MFENKQRTVKCTTDWRSRTEACPGSSSLLTNAKKQMHKGRHMETTFMHCLRVTKTRH